MTPKEVLNGAIYEQEFMHKFSNLITMGKMVLTMLNTRVSMKLVHKVKDGQYLFVIPILKS